MDIPTIKASEWIYPLDTLGKTATVYSVSEYMLNLKIGNRLVNITNFSEYLSSFGISFPKEQFKQAISFIRPGNIVKIRADQLVIYSREGVHSLFFKDVETVSLKLSDFDLTQAPYKRLRKILAKKNLDQLIGLTKEPRAEELFVKLSTAKDLSIEQWQEILTYFIGRGKGSTPSGDDIITAYYAMLVIQKDPKAKTLGQALQAFDLAKTTLLSQSYLQGVIEGHVNSFLYQLFDDLATDASDEQMNRDVERLMYIGHSSGKDMSFGLFLGLGREEDGSKNEKSE